VENVPSVHLGDFTYPLVKFKLRAWLVLEDLRFDVEDAAKNKNREKLIASIYSYVSTASSVSIEDLQKCFWKEVGDAYFAIHNFNAPDPKFPLIKPRPKSIREESGFDYPTRSWYMWANTLASKYGWMLDYIAELHVDEAIGLIQEIYLDDQLNKEWEWSLSENAYSYNESTKKSDFHPLKRPEWMLTTHKIPEIKKVKFRRSDLPMGLVLRWDDGTNSQPQ